MLRNRTSGVALCLSITAVLPCIGQNADRDSTWASFLHAFTQVDFPFHIAAPVEVPSAYPILTDTSSVKAFIAPHGLADSTEVLAGHLLYSTDSFIAITAFVARGEEKAWYFLLFTPDGTAIHKGRLAAFVAHKNTRHEHWSTDYANGRMEHTALFRRSWFRTHLHTEPVAAFCSGVD